MTTVDRLDPSARARSSTDFAPSRRQIRIRDHVEAERVAGSALLGGGTSGQLQRNRSVPQLRRLRRGRALEGGTQHRRQVRMPATQ
jgi:hypothetical protein